MRKSRFTEAQIVAVLMCGFGWLVEAIPWTLIGWVWAYNIVWMFVLGRDSTAYRALRRLSYRAAGEKRSRGEPIAPAACRSIRGKMGGS